MVEDVERNNCCFYLCTCSWLSHAARQSVCHMSYVSRRWPTFVPRTLGKTKNYDNLALNLYSVIISIAFLYLSVITNKPFGLAINSIENNTSPRPDSVAYTEHRHTCDFTALSALIHQWLVRHCSDASLLWRVTSTVKQRAVATWDIDK